MVLCIFSAPVRIPHATTGPTGWLWPNSAPPTSPSCPCCSKVTDTSSATCECHANEFTNHWHVFSSCLCPDMTFINEGNPNYVDKLVNFEKLVRHCPVILLMNLILSMRLALNLSFSSHFLSAWSPRQWKLYEDAEASLMVSDPVGFVMLADPRRCQENSI